MVFIASQWLRIQFFHEYAYHLYGLLVLLIGLTYFMPVIGGSQRWLLVGPISLQPSEIGKLFLVFAIARVLADQPANMNEIKIIFIVFLSKIQSLLHLRIGSLLALVSSNLLTGVL